MNRENHILTCLAEECGEVAKECHKSLRFGLDDQLTLDPHGPRGKTGPTNRAKIRNEFIDLLGAYQMAVQQGLVEDIGLDRLPFWVKELMANKSARITAYMEYAVRVGALEPAGPFCHGCDQPEGKCTCDTDDDREQNRS